MASLRVPLLAVVLTTLGCPPARDPWMVQCPEGSVWDGSRCATLTTGPVSVVADPFVGTFALSTAYPSGEVAQGQATIAPPDGGVYRVRYNLSGLITDGVGLVRDGVFAAGIGGTDSGVAQYAVEAGGRLDGTWVFHGSNRSGLEALTGGNADLSGVYQIETGVGPDGGSYTGTCDLVVTGDLHTLLWHVPNASGGNDTYRGLGLRDGAVLSVGFSTAKAAPLAVVQYRVEPGGKRLVGRRASWATTSPVAAAETLARQ